jgi:hypothetical protein
MQIERVVRLPGSDGKGSTARSLSGRPVNSITQLLEDDLRHTFDNGFFTFRLVNAHLGSGKTTLLLYLHELAKTKPTYENFSVVRFFRLSEIQSIGGSQSFIVKFYSYILGLTFWELLNSSISSIKDTATLILKDYLDASQINNLLAIQSSSPFCSRFRMSFSDICVVFEEFFFEVINRVTQIEPRFTFSYLIDDLDHLKDFPGEFQETRALIKALIRRAYQKHDSKVRLLIYLAGTSENVMKFISEDPVIESLVSHQIIVLSKGYENEFQMIRDKINDRIKGAFKGYKNFDHAWKEIKEIHVDFDQNLRRFYQGYVTAVLEIYERYFKEEPEKSFEGNARDLVEAQCKQIWQNYLSKKAYKLSSVSTTTVLKGHAFDCYVELLHNDNSVAKCFGEAKNYELLSGHLKTFNECLEDVKFSPHPANGDPQDLAFMIAPSCPSLLQRKLELKNINLILSKKVVNNGHSPIPKTAVNLNTADKESIIAALKGTGIRGTKIDELIRFRSRGDKTYENLDELNVDLNLTSAVKEKLKKKIENRQIFF